MNIPDYERYISLMKLGVLDKLFFIDKLFDKWGILLDYGCADGFLTKFIAQVFPEKNVIGYDENVDFLNIAKNSGTMPENVLFTRQLPKTPMDILFLCSVLHEIYAYKSKQEIDEFWQYVFNTGFKKIIIRDMLYDNSQEADFVLQIPKIAVAIMEWCKENNYYGELERFESIYGPLGTPRNITQFLLKYLYISHPNWEHEINEDYLRLSLRNLLKLIPTKYEIVYRESYVLPYLQHRWKQDFGVTLHVKTHAKLILKCKD